MMAPMVVEISVAMIRIPRLMIMVMIMVMRFPRLAGLWSVQVLGREVAKRLFAFHTSTTVTDFFKIRTVMMIEEVKM